MSYAQSSPENPLDWVVSKFARDIPGVAHAVLVSVDGLLIAASEHLPPCLLYTSDAADD